MYAVDLEKAIELYKTWQDGLDKARSKLREAEARIQKAKTAGKPPAPEDELICTKSKEYIAEHESKPPKHDITSYIDSLYTFVLLAASVDYSEV